MSETLTQNINAEGSVLGSILLDKSYTPTVRQILKDRYYFSRSEHRILYDCLCELSEQGDGWDLVLIRDALKAKGDLAAVGGIEYLVTLAETVPSAANAEHYARCVSAAYQRRRIAEQAKSLQRAANEPGDVQEALLGIQSDLNELADEIKEAPSADGAESVKKLITDSINKQRQTIETPWCTLNKLTAALQPGTVTLLCGSPGASKSFAALELLNFVMDAGQEAAAFELEDSEAFHLARMLAQKAETPGLTNPNWIAQHPSIAEAAHSENSDWLTKTGYALDADGGGQVTYEKITGWALQRARRGCKLLIIDPITAVSHKTAQTWVEDNEFLQRIKRIAGDYGAAVILVSHPTKAKGVPGMESLAGGAAFSRFAQTIIWLEAHDTKASDVGTVCGRVQTEHNRTVHILKARLGRGQGFRLAATFTDGLRLLEHGAIVKKRG